MKAAQMSDRKMQQEVARLDALVNSALTANGGRITQEIDNMKKQSRVMKNRLAAKKSRESKKDWLSRMQSRLSYLESENKRLRKLLQSHTALDSSSQKENSVSSCDLSIDVSHVDSSPGNSHSPSFNCLPPALTVNRSCPLQGHAKSSLQSN
jgi:uncharacterized protein YdcH (DUF465 family)